MQWHWDLSKLEEQAANRNAILHANCDDSIHEESFVYTLQSKSYQCSGVDRLIFAIFLEGENRDDGCYIKSQQRSVLERILNACVRNCQPAPVLIHTELIIPHGHPYNAVHFATYMNMKSGWRNGHKSDERHYYLTTNGGRWRALPIYSKNAINCRAVADECVDVKYSYCRYITATKFGGIFACFMRKSMRAHAHCATLTARVIQGARLLCLQHHESRYSPSLLYNELVSHLAKTDIHPPVFDESVKKDLDCLCYHTNDDVRKMSSVACLNAISFLSSKVMEQAKSTNSEEAVHSQRLLATALLRWSGIVE
jgi:hypothetical protein